MPFVRAGGARDATTLVRLTSFASTPEQKAEIAAQREWCVVNVIPLKPGSVNDSLVPMRDWMAERSDVVVAVGGKWYKANQSRAGVPLELLTMLGYGKPGFIVAGFGGAIAGYLEDNESVLSKLHNGWDEETNLQMAAATDLHQLVSAITRQLTFLPLLKGENLKRTVVSHSLSGRWWFARHFHCGSVGEVGANASWRWRARLGKALRLGRGYFDRGYSRDWSGTRVDAA